MKAKKPFLGLIFPHISGSITLIVNGVHPCVDSHQPREFHENWFNTATCIVTVIIIIVSWKYRSVTFEFKLKNMYKVFLRESKPIRKKILRRINFVLIKFSLKTLFFEKLWNECKNPSFLHKAMCMESGHGSMEMRRCFSTFMTLYFRRLWYLLKQAKYFQFYASGFWHIFQCKVVASEAVFVSLTPAIRRILNVHFHT